MPKANGSGRALPDGVDAPNYNRPLRLPVVDFARADRASSSLEVDFPIGPINTLAQLEINAKKPIYEMGKWWARRQSSIFRSLLIAGATEAPENDEMADRRIWEAYYANHQKGQSFTGIRVLDPFMGGGTTLIEGARLGFDVTGVDLNPVAWFVTKTAITDIDPQAVENLFADVERMARPQITPYTTTTCPRGHGGRWYRADDKLCPFDVRKARDLGFTLAGQPESFDIFSVTEAQRAFYRYAGPEIIYTFWVGHGPCERCGHRTPVLRSPVVATKEITARFVKAECSGCGLHFDWELEHARMAPNAPLVVALDEPPFVAPEPDAIIASCPSCGTEVSRPPGGKPGRKKVALTLMVHPRWLSGVPGSDAEGLLGGWAGATPAADQRWIEARSKDLSLIEVRGTLPTRIIDPLDPLVTIDTGKGTAKRVVRHDRESGELKEKDEDGTFVCGSCGSAQSLLGALKESGETPPVYPYVLQGYCPECDRERRPYSGRFFATPTNQDRDRWLAAVAAWEEARDGALGELVPSQKLPFAHLTYQRNDVPSWGYTHWWKMFNPRQLLTHVRLLDAILTVEGSYSQEAREAALLAFQQYLRNQNMFCIWNIQADKIEPFFSNNNYHPTPFVVENGCFSNLGRGNWNSCVSAILEGLRWRQAPWEKAKAGPNSPGKGIQLPTDDPVRAANVAGLLCRSATDLSTFEDRVFDMVITDPPFGGNVFYADMADFFYAWLRRPLSRWYPETFAAPETNKVQEAIANPAEYPDTRSAQEKRDAKRSGVNVESPADASYRETLTECWRECARVMKDGGTLAFTFHHSEYQAWLGVLRSLFDAGFVLVATYPIRSDESKGDEAAYGSKKIEYDIIHVCRKRLQEPERVSWARMRRWVREELERLHSLLEHYQKQDLSEADIRVILRGKALQFYSQHYGQVYTGIDEPVDVADAVIGINAILDEERLRPVDRPPDAAEPLTRLYLRVFKDRTQIARDDLRKMLMGTGASPQQFQDPGWTVEENRMVSIVPVQQRFGALRKRRRDQMKSDLDQVHFLIGAALPGSGMSIREELEKATFTLKPSVPEILRWLAEREQDISLRAATERATNLVDTWLGERRGARGTAAGAQLPLFE